jgi:hypothetical protein
MRPTKTLIGLMLLIASLPAAAFAQEAPEGPALRLSGSFLYDSNVSRSSEQVALERGISQADEIYNVSAVVDYTKQFGRGSAFVTGTAGYTFYQNNTILNREHIDVAGGFVQSFGDCSVQLRGNYLRQQSDLQDIDVTVIAKNTQTVPVASLGFSCTQPSGFSPYADVSETWAYNSSPIVQLSDYRSLVADAGVAYRQPSLGEIDLFAQYDGTDFPKRQVLVADPLGLVDDSYIVNGGGIRLVHTFGAKLTTSATVRYTTLHPRSPLEQGFSGVTYEVDLGYAASSRLQLSLSAARSTNPSNQIGTAYSVDEDYSAGASYKINSRLNFNLSGRWANQSYSGDFLPGSGVITSQTIKSISGYLSYNFSRNLSLNLNAGHDERTANIATFNFASTRVGISVTAAF